MSCCSGWKLTPSRMGGRSGNWSKQAHVSSRGPGGTTSAYRFPNTRGSTCSSTDVSIEAHSTPNSGTPEHPLSHSPSHPATWHRRGSTTWFRSSPRRAYPGKSASQSSVGEGGRPFEPSRVRDDLVLRAPWASRCSLTADRFAADRRLRPSFDSVEWPGLTPLPLQGSSAGWSAVHGGHSVRPLRR